MALGLCLLEDRVDQYWQRCVASKPDCREHGPDGRTGRPERSDGTGCFASHIPTLVVPHVVLLFGVGFGFEFLS